MLTSLSFFLNFTAILFSPPFLSLCSLHCHSTYSTTILLSLLSSLYLKLHRRSYLSNTILISLYPPTKSLKSKKSKFQKLEKTHKIALCHSPLLKSNKPYEKKKESTNPLSLTYHTLSFSLLNSTVDFFWNWYDIDGKVRRTV